MYRNIFLWSNGHQYKDITEFGDALSKSDVDFNTDGLNVFINTCIPLRACCERFSGHECISIHCGVPKQTTIHCMFGFDEMRKYHEYLKRSYVLYTHPYQGGRCVTLLPDSGEFDINNRSNEIFHRIDESPFAERYPKDKPNQTTGFLSFLFLKQIYPDSNIVLVNFGVKDDRFNRTKKEHSIEVEQQIFDEMKVQRLYV